MNSYPQIFQLGHPAIADLFADDVLLEEKVDGSQLSFGIIDGDLLLRSKNAKILPEDPGMFGKAIEEISALNAGPGLTPGWIYRGEYLSKPKHNTLAYERTPAHNVIIFDIMVGYEAYASRAEKEAECQRLGLEIVPVLHQGRVASLESLEAFLATDSILGGQKIEGMVIKNYSRFGKDKKCLMGKYVRPDFREANSKAWKEAKKKENIVENLILGLRTEARWRKAVQHLRDLGLLLNEPKDIGLLIKEVPADIEKENKEEIKEALFKHYWPDIRRGVTFGLPEFYKRELAADQWATKADVAEIEVLLSEANTRE